MGPKGEALRLRPGEWVAIQVGHVGCVALLNGLEGWYDPAGRVSRHRLLAQMAEITLSGILKQTKPKQADG